MSTHYTNFVYIFFVAETFRNNLTNQQMINLWTFLMNFLKSEMLVCTDALINHVFHILSDKERMSRSLILPSLNIWDHFLIFDSLITPSPYTAISRQYISIRRTFCAFKNQITAHSSQLKGFLIFLLIFKCYKKCKIMDSVHHSLGFLLKEKWDMLALKRCNSLTCTSIMWKWILPSERTSY